jgi:uncharacterized membrane protein SpoIIM required for sporulation
VKQDVFEAKYSSTWDTFEKWIAVLSGRKGLLTTESQERAEIGSEFPAMYRQICHHLSLARTRRYSIALQQRLNQLALEGHQHLYRTRTPFFATIGHFLVSDFPCTFRKRWRYMLTSALVFYLPAFAMAIAMQVQPDLIYTLMEPLQVSQMEEMYDPENRVLGRERQSETDVNMFGFYIYNNISIGFQTFAGGLLFGLGSLFYLIFNGLIFGAVSSHLTAMGFTETFWPFVVGHSAFELTAIVIFGGVGLMLGLGAIAPGQKGRWHAIRDQAISGMPLVYGGALMLVAAAFVEAFWSSTTWPPLIVKYSVGAIFWLCVGLYFALMGRNES